MTIWFTADQHFNHVNIIGYCNRPFRDIYAMNDMIIRQHNTVVAPDDVVWHLGDFAMSKSGQEVRLLLEQLHGQHHLVTGNHDYLTPKQFERAGFVSITTCEMVGGFHLAHHPPYSRGAGKNWLTAHVHDLWTFKPLYKPYSVRSGGMMNIGVDTWDFRPISLQKVEREFNKFLRDESPMCDWHFRWP